MVSALFVPRSTSDPFVPRTFLASAPVATKATSSATSAPININFRIPVFLLGSRGESWRPSPPLLSHAPHFTDKAGADHVRQAPEGPPDWGGCQVEFSYHPLSGRGFRVPARTS